MMDNSDVQRVNQTGERLASERIAFFERLVLLDGGTIALSITALGVINADRWHSHQWLLQAAWIVLGIGVMSALARNLANNWVEGKQHRGDALRAVAVKYRNAAETKPDNKRSFASMADACEILADDVGVVRVNHVRCVSVCEWMACISSGVGMTLLVAFGVLTV